MRSKPLTMRGLHPGDERGQALILAVVALTALIAVAAFALDTAVWYVHGRHLQTQADAAAFAGAQVLSQGYENGSCSDSSIDAAVHLYDGSSTYNQQVPSPSPQISYATTWQGSSHNLYSLINQSNFENQTIPGDTIGSGSNTGPCATATVDVKATESNLPSFLTIFEPPYINKQAQVQLQTEQEGSSSPFVLPNILTPSDVAVFVVSGPDQTPSFASDTVLAGLSACSDNGNTAPCLTSSNSGATWSATGVSVPFGTSSTSLVVATSTTAMSSSTVSAVTTGAQLNTFCGSVKCYDSTDGVGLTYTRAYTASTPNFPTAAPVIEDTSLSDSSATATTACESAGSTGLFTGFMTSSTSCSLNATADINFGNESCSDLNGNLGVTLTITASNGNSSALACPNGNSPTAGSATGLWTTSSPISVAASSGPITFDLSWSRTGGGSTTPKETWELGGITNGNKTGQCGNNTSACTKDFGIIQRVFTGAYDQNSALASNSGDISGAALTNGGSELFATPANASLTNLGVTIDFQSLTNTSATSGGYVPNGSFTDIAYGTQQANGLADCGQGVNNKPGPNGFDVQENAIAGVTSCNNYPIEPSSFTSSNCTSTLCPGTVPGGKFLQWMDGGLATRIYGCPEDNKSTQNKMSNGCASNPMTVAECSVDPNYWDTQNQMTAVEANSSDPRLLTIMVTDPGSLANGNHEVPVRHYAEFYVTGWTNDPCSGVNDSGKNTTNGLYYQTDDVAPTDAAGDTFLVGHFIKVVTEGAVGSGTACVMSALDKCTETVTK